MMSENGSKHDNFVRLAEARTTRALKSLRLIRNLSNRSSYDYSREEVDAIVASLQSEINSLKNAFDRKLTSERAFVLVASPELVSGRN